jgi:hypothetical protein
MGSARFLNIFLGASPGLAGLLFYNDNFLLTRLLVACILMLLYVLCVLCVVFLAGWRLAA